METFSIEQKKPFWKLSEILPSNFHLKTKQYVGHVVIGNEHYYTDHFDCIEEARTELRCLEKKLSYELIETIDSTSYHPERAKLMEEAYQASGRTNGLYTGLMFKDGSISDNTSN